jgi:alanine racemase
VNGWYVILSVNEEQKIQLIAQKVIGTLPGSALESSKEAMIKISMESTEQRSPKLAMVDDPYNPKYLELDDGLNRINEKYKEEGHFYQQQYNQSSIVTVEEFFSEFVDFEELLKEKKLDEYLAKFTEVASKVQRPYDKTYLKIEK